MRTIRVTTGKPQRSLPALSALLGLLIITAPALANFRYPASLETLAADSSQQLHETHAPGEEISHGLSREFVWLYERGYYPQALATAERAHALASRLHGENHINNADPLLKLGIIHQTLGHLGRARDCFEQSLRVLQHNHSRDIPQIAITLTNLGGLYFELGDYPASEQAHRRALDLRRAAFGRHSAETAQSHYNLGVLYEHQRDYNRAARQYQNAIDLWSETLGENHPFTDNTRQNLARVHLAQRRHIQITPARDTASPLVSREPLHRRSLSATLNPVNETNGHR